MTTLALPGFLRPPQRFAPGPVAGFPPDGDDFAHRLYLSIRELWELLLSQESWSLRTKSEDLNVRPLLSSTSTEGPGGLVEEEGFLARDVDMVSMAPSSPELPEAAILCHLSEAQKWDLVRSWLGEQRDKLIVWKSGFSKEELCRITADQSSRQGNSVLESLVGIAESLVMMTNLGGSTSGLHAPAIDLTKLVDEGKARLRALDWDERDSVLSRQATTGNVRLEGDETLLRLGDQVFLLDRLSYSTRLELEFSSDPSMSGSEMNIS